MPLQPFGQADPIYDALRVFSNQALEAGPGDGTSAGGGIENKIYLWPADGSTITTFDPDESGLIASLAAAVSGDTVWLPSIEIATTASLTVPAGVTVIGISYGAVISASGFSGTAIVLSVGSTVTHFTLVFVSNGNDAIGIEAGAVNSRVIEVDVTVSGGAVQNHAINGGASVGANEFWALLHRTGVGYSIIWSDTYDFSDAVNDTAWNKIESWPATFDSPTNNGLFAMNYNGSELYIARTTNIWRCTNVAAIRAAPATVPTWSAILDSSTVVDSPYVPIAVNTLYWWNDRLCAQIRTNRTGTYYGEYLSGSWSWTYQAIDTTQAQYITRNRIMYVTGGAQNFSTMKETTGALTTLFSLDSGFGNGSTQPMWRNYDSGTEATTTVFQKTATSTKIVDITGATLHDTALTNKAAVWAGGALFGLQSNVVMEDGELFVSLDGTTFSAGATWEPGIVLDAFLIGGGALIWTRNRSVADNVEVTHISLDDGATFADKTGDLWTVISGSGLGVIIQGCQLIFLP